MKSLYQTSQRLYHVALVSAELSALVACSPDPAGMVDEILDGQIRYETTIGPSKYELSQKLVQLESDGMPVQGIQTDLQVTTRNIENPRDLLVEHFADYQSDGEVDTATRAITLEGFRFTGPFLEPQFPQQLYEKHLERLLREQ